jgi:hypothetical protein
MSLYESRTDRLRQAEAMRVLASFFGRDFKQSTSKTAPYDFFTVTKGAVCEHKYRHYLMPELTKMGGIWFETHKYNGLIEAASRRGDVPLFVVTVRDGYVLYVDIRRIDTTKVGTATRPNPRDDYDTDPCYIIPTTMFKGAGKAKTFVRPERKKK